MSSALHIHTSTYCLESSTYIGKKLKLIEQRRRKKKLKTIQKEPVSFLPFRAASEISGKRENISFVILV